MQKSELERLSLNDLYEQRTIHLGLTQIIQETIKELIFKLYNRGDLPEIRDHPVYVRSGDNLYCIAYTGTNLDEFNVYQLYRVPYHLDLDNIPDTFKN